jgi:hypothetical protein
MELEHRCIHRFNLPQSVKEKPVFAVSSLSYLFYELAVNKISVKARPQLVERN